MSDPSPVAPAPVAAEPTAAETDALITSKPFVALLLLASFVGVLVSLAAWCFLEGIFQLQQELFVRIPDSLGYHDHDPPLWYLLPLLGAAGVIVAFAVARLPGKGGHIPVKGLQSGAPAQPVELPGILLAAIGSIGLGLVLGPEAPLIALGAGLALVPLTLARRDIPPQVLPVVAASGSFAAVSFLFGSPLVAAVLLVEASALGGQRMRIMLIPGLAAAGLGSLVSTGMGSVTGLSSTDYSLPALALPVLDGPKLADFGWTLVLAPVIAAVVSRVILPIGRATERRATPRPFVILPLVGATVAVLAWAFGQITDKAPDSVLLSGQDALPKLVGDAGTWSLGTLAALLLMKGAAYAISLGSFRGGPTFPALFLGAAAGIMADRLPGMSTTPAIAICMAAATVSVLRLPLSSGVIVGLLTIKGGAGTTPLIVVAVIVGYVTTLLLGRRATPVAEAAGEPAPGERPVAATAAG